jgi:hypothetical protein
MRVFILCTGRSGSKTIIRACEKIQNFTCGHEILAQTLGEKRFDYPDNHIEADNRLTWFLGTLDKKYGDDAVYVHLIRSRPSAIKSFNLRWEHKISIVRAFAEGVYMLPMRKLNEEQKLQVCADYYDCVNTNIEYFFKDKTKTLKIELENIKQGFEQLWNMIGAQGDLEAALKTFDTSHNKAKEYSAIATWWRKLRVRFR